MRKNNFDIGTAIGVVSSVIDSGLFQSAERKKQIQERERAAVAMGFQSFDEWKKNGGASGLIPMNRPDAQAAYNYMYDFGITDYRPSNAELIRAGYLSPDGSTWSEDGQFWVDKNAISLKYFGVPYDGASNSPVPVKGYSENDVVIPAPTGGLMKSGVGLIAFLGIAGAAVYLLTKKNP